MNSQNINPKAQLNDFDKDGVLNHDQLHQLSIIYNIRLDKVYMLEDFLNKGAPVGNYIINLDLDNRGGSHFIACVSLPDKIYWYDPFGTINNILKDFIEKTFKKKVIYNNVQNQKYQEKNCGLRCLSFLLEAENIKTDKEFNKAIEEVKYYKYTVPKQTDKIK